MAREVLGALLAALLVSGCADAGTDVLLDETLPFLTWPVPGVDGADWVINNYVDLASGGVLLDYRGGTKVYDGHRGVDVDVPNFRWMDADFPVLAAAPGTVVEVHDGEFDRNVSCTGSWNVVTIRHEDGSRAIYGHMKSNSILVSVGETVSSGQPLAVIGSSGCSTQPHLHFEMTTEGGGVIDPFDAGLWIDPPRYDTPLTFMDINVQDGAIASVDRLKDPLPNIVSIANGSTLGVGVSMAGGGTGDQVRLTLSDADGTLEFQGGVTFDRLWRHTYWYWNVFVDGEPGVWTVVISVNGNTVETHAVTVS